MLSKGRQFKFN